MNEQQYGAIAKMWPVFVGMLAGLLAVAVIGAVLNVLFG